ncbi:hypothetical protein N9442_04915 [Gammaproteobacteria bacterium]|nr:hypothetical protein [Gammaproteobacteria bacterium]
MRENKRDVTLFIGISKAALLKNIAAKGNIPPTRHNTKYAINVIWPSSGIINLLA